MPRAWASAATATINAATLEATTSFGTGRSFVLGGSGSTILVDAGQTYAITNTASSNISGPTGVLNATVTGSLAVLSLDDRLNNNSFGGGSVLSGGGTVQIFTNTGLGSGGTATINSATLEVSATFGTGRSFVLGSASSAISVDVGSTYSITNTAGSNISGPTGVLNATGAGTLVLDDRLKANSFGGGSVLSGGGTVQIYTATSLGNGGPAAISGATLEAEQTITSSRALTLAGASNFIKVDGTSVYTLNGTINDGASPGTLNVNGTGTLVLTNGTSTYSGNTFVTSGTLVLNPASSTSSVTGTGDVTVSGTTGVLSTSSAPRSAAT